MKTGRPTPANSQLIQMTQSGPGLSPNGRPPTTCSKKPYHINPAAKMTIGQIQLGFALFTSL